MLRSFYGMASPLFAIIAFLVGMAKPQVGILLMLGAILFHMWSQEDER